MKAQTWRIAIKSIFLFNLVLLAILGAIVLVAAADSTMILLPIAVIALLIGLAGSVVGWIVKRSRQNQTPFWRTWMANSLVWMLVLLTLVSLPFLSAISYNATHPLALPRVVLTNGEKEVVFQGMVHVGSEPFYQGIVFDMLQAVDQGYVMMFEGVLSGTPENEARFNAMLGTQGTNLTQVYDQTAALCNLHYQDRFLSVFFDDFAQNPVQFLHADVTVDDMMAEWDRLVAANPSLVDGQDPVRVQVETDVLDSSVASSLSFLESLSPSQRSLIALACQTIFNIRLDLEEDQSPFFEWVVLDYRNQHLADLILDQSNDLIYITYGYGHFHGVFELLQEADPDWEIVDVRWIQAIEDRDELKRDLLLDD